MHQADRGRFWIDDINRAAIRDVNAKQHSALIGDERIACREMSVRFNRFIHDCYFIAVNLLGDQQRPIAESTSMTNLPVCPLKPR